jgi:hypothetical protein
MKSGVMMHKDEKEYFWIMTPSGYPEIASVESYQQQPQLFYVKLLKNSDSFICVRDDGGVFWKCKNIDTKETGDEIGILYQRIKKPRPLVD